MDLLAYALIVVFPLLVVVAALRDLTTFTIPNWTSLGLVAAFYPAALAVGAPLAIIGTCSLVGLAALALGMAMFALNWVGGGDAKLFAATALWMGWPDVLGFLMATALAGGALALILLQMRSNLMRPYLQRGPAWVGRLVTSPDAPYGLAIAIGALAMLPQSPLVELLAR